MNPQFGLIGKHLGHSFSKDYFTGKFREMRLRASYQNFELDSIENLPSLLEAEPGLLGFNVTIPYKTSILPFLTELSPIAQAVGAVNTVKVDGDRLVGHNTDVIGFRDTMSRFYQAPPGGKALILGTGGASKAVAHVLTRYFSFDEVLFASRKPQNGRHLSYADVNRMGLEAFPLVVNTTPLGMAPNTDFPQLPYDTVGSSNHFYDLIYNPPETTFLALGKLQGARTMNGMDMLIGQAEASWDIWKEGMQVGRA